jgi:hypothetical protein
MEHTRDHIIFFMAQKMYALERSGSREAFNRLVEHFEQINLDGLLEYLTRYYAVDVDREMDDFGLVEGELVFVSRAREDKYKTREILVALYDGRHDAIRLIEEERKRSAGFCVEVPQFNAETCATGIANGFRDEILGVYERQLKRDDLPA